MIFHRRTSAYGPVVPMVTDADTRVVNEGGPNAVAVVDRFGSLSLGDSVHSYGYRVLSIGSSDTYADAVEAALGPIVGRFAEYDFGDVDLDVGVVWDETHDYLEWVNGVPYLVDTDADVMFVHLGDHRNRAPWVLNPA